MTDEEKVAKLEGCDLLLEADRLDMMPLCYEPCPPFYDVCNHAFNAGHDYKCHICFKIFKLEDSIE